MVEGAPTNADASLVLFIGAALKPDAALHQMLAADAMRCLWLRGHEQALVASGFAAFDAIVIDADQLGSAATRVIAALRAALRCPIVVVAPHADEIDEIVALELGADAYLTRPLAPRRLRAHLGALLRLRATPPSAAAAAPGAGHSDDAGEPAQLHHPGLGGWVLSRRQRRLLNNADNASPAARRIVELTDVQTALLAKLMAHAGEVVPRAALVAALPSGRELHSRSIDVYVHRLRNRLREVGVSAFAIEAARGLGYRLCVAIDAERPEPAVHGAPAADSGLGRVIEHAA